MKAYVTLLSSENYLRGVVALHRALRSVKSKYPLYCVLSKNLSADTERELLHYGILYIRLSYSVTSEGINANSNSVWHWDNTFDKFQIWGLIQFEKIVLLDSDMLVLRNLDSLFERASFSAVSNRGLSPTTQDWLGFNSGLMVIVPDKSVADKLRILSKSIIEKNINSHTNTGDQDILNAFCPDWEQNEQLHLDPGYNVYEHCVSYYIKVKGFSMQKKCVKPILVVHFIGKWKPWMKKYFIFQAFERRCNLWRKSPYSFIALLKYLWYCRP